MRKPYMGLWNVVRFNWPKYAFGVVVLATAFAASAHTTGAVSIALSAVGALACLALILPLLASHIIYDSSALYRLPWLQHLPRSWTGSIVNINAGFDETSEVIRTQLPNCDLEVADFYDPVRHTEASIERARRTTTTYPGTRIVSTDLLPYTTGSIDLVLAFLSLHEVRDRQERIHMLTAIRRVLKPDGRLMITEHLRDLPNFLAFNFGFLHFHARATWLRAFELSGFEMEAAQKTTAFITTYTLRPR